jgi:general secretion pathway protein A
VPRKINALCSRLMLFGFLEETHLVDEETVVQVADELKTELGDVTASGGPAISDSRTDSASGGDLDQRLTKIEQKLDRNDQAIKRALALIAASLDKESQ